jgi:hypothetical protein
MKDFRLAGLVVRTSVAEPGGRVQFGLLRKTLFMDDRLWILLIALCPDGSRQEQFYLFPVNALPELTSSTPVAQTTTYHGNITLHRPGKKWQPYALDSRQLGPAVLDRIFRRT